MPFGELLSVSCLLPVSSQSSSEAATILIVDDEPDSVRVLSQLLSQEGYAIRRTTDSKLALRSAQLVPPDLILVDVMMPGMNGFELCQQLKQGASTQTTPVIFITALEDIEGKVRAFAAGASDYLIKPFQAEEVLMRIRNQITIHHQQVQLQQKNQQLLQEIEQRQQAEKKYRDIFENASEGIFQATLAGRYISANPAMAKIYGYETPAQLISSITNIGDQIYVGPKRRQELSVLLNHLGILEDTESEAYRRDGSKFWISENIRLVRDEQGNPAYYEGTAQDVTQKRQAEAALQRQRASTERLLYNILPYQIAQKLQKASGTVAEQFDQVSVLFADLVDFTKLAHVMSPTALVDLLNQIFSTFDQLVETYKVEKIKTIGDAYMVAAGLPAPMADHAQVIAHLALDMREAMARFSVNGQPLQIRIGIHSGSVVAGVIGWKKFAYDLWGETVNLASRLETTSLPGQIQVSPALYEALKPGFKLSPRGEVFVKGLGNLPTYWLEAALHTPPRLP